MGCSYQISRWVAIASIAIRAIDFEIPTKDLFRLTQGTKIVKQVKVGWRSCLKHWARKINA